MCQSIVDPGSVYQLTFYKDKPALTANLEKVTFCSPFTGAPVLPTKSTFMGDPVLCILIRNRSVMTPNPVHL